MHKAQSAPHLLSFSFGDQSVPAVNNDEEYDYSNSQTLRRELQKQGDAFESVLDNAMRRNVARRQAREREAEFLLEAPGGIIPIKAYCENKKVKFIEIKNLPSFVDKLDVKIKTSSFGEINVSTVFGGDSFIICEAKDFPAFLGI